MCFDKRVLTGLGVIAAAVLAINPGLFGSALPILILLACPLSMVVMMRGMGGMRRQSCAADEQDQGAVAHQSDGESAHDNEVAELRDEVARLRAELQLRGTPATGAATEPSAAAQRGEKHSRT